VFGRCDTTTGIAAFTALVDDVMNREPYASAKRVFWIVDNRSSHRGQAAADRLATLYPNAIMVHTPVHASWLNQVEIYFSIIQRKVLSPNEFAYLAAVEQRLLPSKTGTTRPPYRSNGNTPPPISTGTSNDSTSTNVLPAPHNPRRTNESDHLASAGSRISVEGAIERRHSPT
jgi:DDE superfamily endonuclease